MADDPKTIDQVDAEREANSRAEERRAYERRRMAAGDPAIVQITADDAAARIRQSGLLDDAHPMSPEDRHRANFAGRVCAALGLDPTVENFARVDAAMRELNIVPHEGHEYPKWVKTGRKEQVWDVNTDSYVDGKKDEVVCVHDADEEAEATSGKAIDPASGHVTGSDPEPHTDVPTRGLIPTRPGDSTADAPAAGFQRAGAGRLVNEETAPETVKPAVPPKAPQRNR